MKLVMLYGPPGVGKLTVARALAKKTGYKVLHNHLTIELLCSLFEWGSKPFNELVHKYRMELLEAAAKYNVPGVITTYVYAAEVDDATVRRIVQRLRKSRIEICLVQLVCSQAELERRVRQDSRKAFTKIRQVKHLRALMKKYELFDRIKGFPSFSLDTTDLSPAKTASAIVKHFSLPREA